MSKPKKPVEVVVFNNPWKGKDKTSNANVDKQSASNQGIQGTSNERPVFDQKKAKNEVRKLGIHGMDKKNRQNAMADLLIELGAKPPRRKAYNIKQHQEMTKKKIEEEKIQMTADGKEEEQEKNQKKKPKGKRKRDKDDILNYVDGQVGFYKHGVQFIKKAKRR